MKKFFEEFKAFALRGNVMDLAVGVIIGGAFQSIVTSLVNDIISPLIGSFAQADFTSLTVTINGVELGYGAFITSVINFIIMAFVIFTLVKILNRLSRPTKKEQQTESAPTTKICPYCKSEIALDATRCPHCTSELK